MQNNIPTVYISEIYCCIVKSTNLSTILQFCTKYMKIKFKNIVLSAFCLRACVQCWSFLNTSCLMLEYWRGVTACMYF